MKKTLKLTLLAAAAVLLLTSCDAMLESLFPSETGQSPKVGSNTLTIEVQGYDYYYDGTYVDAKSQLWAMKGYYGLWGDDFNGYYNNTNTPLYPVYVTLFDTATGTAIGTKTAYFTGTGGPAPRIADVTFDTLNDGAYYYDVWYDVNGSGLLDAETSYSGYYYTNIGFIGTASLSSIHLPYKSAATVTMTAQLNEYPYYAYSAPYPG
jgi:hypothetical protein